MEDNSDMPHTVGIESSASTPESMKDILQLSNRSYSAGNRLKICCRPSYRIRKLKNKAALLILVWNSLVISVFYYLTTYSRTFVFNSASYNIYSITWGLTLPIAGWLADVYFGRYKVIRWSIMIMWITSVLAVASSVLSELAEHHYHNTANKYVTTFLLLMMSIGFGGYPS